MGLLACLLVKRRQNTACIGNEAADPKVSKTHRHGVYLVRTLNMPNNSQRQCNLHMAQEANHTIYRHVDNASHEYYSRYVNASNAYHRHSDDTSNCDHSHSGNASYENNHPLDNVTCDVYSHIAIVLELPTRKVEAGTDAASVVAMDEAEATHVEVRAQCDIRASQKKGCYRSEFIESQSEFT